MTICGYDERMGAGLREFAEGLVLAIREKARKRKCTEVAQLAHEADQITILSEFLKREMETVVRGSKQESSTLAFFGLVLMCKGILGELIVDRPDKGEFDGTVESNVEKLISLLRSFEISYDMLPEPSSAVRRTSVAWAEVQSLL